MKKTLPDPRPIAAEFCTDCGATDGQLHEWSCGQVPYEMYREFVIDLPKSVRLIPRPPAEEPS